MLLSTDVGLLAWTGAGNTGGVNQPSPEQILTYISIIFSAGSVIIGLMVPKLYRERGMDTPLQAVMSITI